jgi:hypothetical protein
MATWTSHKSVPLQRFVSLSCQSICDMGKLIFCALWFLPITSFTQIRLEAVVGYDYVNMSNIGKLPFKDYKYYSPINSFLEGVGADVPLGKKMFLEPALLFFGNGTHFSEQTLNPGIDWFLDVNINLYYIRIPVNFPYKMDIVQFVHVFEGLDCIFQEEFGVKKMAN